MSRDLLIAIIVSLLLHGGAALGGHFFKEKPAAAVAPPEIPTIEIQLPPPPEPEEPEVIESSAADSEPGDIADLAPPMQTDVPVAATDATFTQQWKPTPPQIAPSGNALGSIPVITRPVASTGKGLGNFFDLASLDKNPAPIVQPRPNYPFDLKRSGIEGEVLVGFKVNPDGTVRDPYIIRSTNPGFEEVVLATVLRWRFRPGEKNGVHVGTNNVQILIPFSLKSDR